MNQSAHGILLSILIIGFTLTRVLAAPSLPGNEVAFYIDTYGEVLPEQDPQVARVHQVFARVRAVADKNGKRLTKLVVVNSRGDPWAIALPDGHIVLSKEAVALCHRQAAPEEAEARLSFVLGHELAHLANDDFWHREMASFLATHPATHDIAAFLRDHRQTKASELAADEKGFIYAAMAGYRVDLLLASRPEKPQFFEFWTQQTHTQVQTSHPQPELRAELLKKQLQDIHDKLGFFEFGVRLSHFDYCDDAIYFLREFQKVFPGREVLNNLGYCYLQLARQEMSPERAYFYWMPLLLDGETRAGALVERGGPSLKTLKQAIEGKAEGYLQQAAEYLQQAIQADPGYVPARLNLAVAFLYLGKPHQARATLVDARELAPDDPAIPGLEALSLYEQSEASLDLWPEAVAKLEKLASSPAASPELLFNLARLLEIRPRPAEARDYWNQLAPLVNQLPEPIRALVCHRQSTLPPQSCDRSAASPAKPLPWRWPLSVNGFERLSPQALQNALPGWKALSFDWYKEKLHGHIYQHPGGKAAVLELDQFPQLQVLRGNQLGTPQDIAASCPQSLRQRNLAQGTVWSCTNWAILVKGKQVQEAWWVAK